LTTALHCTEQVTTCRRIYFPCLSRHGQCISVIGEGA